MQNALRSLRKDGFKAGDIVRHTSEFLRSIYWILDVPINGQVNSIDQGRVSGYPDVLTVEWSDGNVTKILDCNVEFCPRGKQLTLKRRGES